VTRVAWFSAALVLALAALVAGCGGTPTLSKPDYQASVVKARDRTDYALAQITQVKTKQAFLNQMETSADLIDNAADDFAGAGSAKGFEDTTNKLTEQFRQLAADLRGTSRQIDVPDYADLLNSEGISFQSWVNINNIFASLGKQGIVVAPLKRH
jgi:hypothetical protein